MKDAIYLSATLRCVNHDSLISSKSMLFRWCITFIDISFIQLLYYQHANKHLCLQEEMFGINEKDFEDIGETTDKTRIQSLSKERHNFNISPPTISRGNTSESAQIAFGLYRSPLPSQSTRQIAAFDNSNHSTQQIRPYEGSNFSPHTATYPSRQTSSPYQQNNAAEMSHQPLYCLYINEKTSQLTFKMSTFASN